VDIEIEDGRRIVKLNAGTTLAIQVTSALRTTPDRIEITGTVDRSSETINAIFDANRQGFEVLLKPAE